MQGFNGYPSMTTLYLNAMDRLWQICPDCLFLVEGVRMSALYGIRMIACTATCQLRVFCMLCRHRPERPARHLVRPCLLQSMQTDFLHRPKDASPGARTASTHLILI